MRLIRPTNLTDAMLTSSTAPETDYPAWSSATAYAVGARVILTATHRRYEALAASTNVTPSTDPTKWLDLGPPTTGPCSTLGSAPPPAAQARCRWVWRRARSTPWH